MKRLQAIYEPTGAALEYAPLAVNLYDGCPHGCTYCYVPGCLRRTREEFHDGAAPRRNILEKLDADCDTLALAGDRREILLCFACDPYPLGWPTSTTRSALEIIGRRGLRATVLTKNGPSAMADFDLMAKYGFRFGTSLSFLHDEPAREWEPHAPPLSARIASIVAAMKAGLDTWISVEPVLVVDEAFELFAELSEQGHQWKIGKWNHDHRAAAIDWKAFLVKARRILADEDVCFKKALLKAAGEES